MLSTNWSSRCAASPWWPLVRWLGVPATLSNLSLACWPMLKIHLILHSGPYSLVGGGVSAFDFLNFATTATMLLVAVQLLVASLVLVCGPGTFWLRLATYAGFIFWLVGSLAAGFVVSYWLRIGLESVHLRSNVFIHDTNITFGGGGLSLAGTLPIILLAIQFPYWLVRTLAGWRLQRVGADEPPTERNLKAESLSIRNLLEATAIVAVSLGLLQLADQHTPQATPGTHLLSILAIAGVVAALVFILGLPFLGLFLRGVELRIAWAITLATAVFCTAGLAIVALAYGSGSEFWRTIATTFFGFLVLFSSQALALSLLRLYGWRLVGRGKPSTANSE